jgi:hypothetical protein
MQLAERRLFFLYVDAHGLHGRLTSIARATQEGEIADFHV